MSKALVIRGADFSENAVAQVGIELPYDAEVSYLQGDGAAYIKTGIYADANTRFEVAVNIQNPSGNLNIIGSRISTNEGNLIAYYGWGATAADKAWNWRYGTELLGLDHSGATGDFLVSNVSAANILAVSGASSGSVSASSASFSGKEMYLFVWNKGDDSPGTIAGSALKIKSCKIYQGQNLVRNYIPVRVGQVGYLYDRVSRTLFGNAASSGAFTVGADK